MPGKSRHCVLCKQFYPGEEVTLFRAPSCEKSRQRWSRLCGMPLTVNHYVCMYHFKLQDFIDPPTSVIGPARLVPDAVPSLRKGDFTTPTFSLLLTKPPHASTSEEGPLPPLELIDEKIFDEQHIAGDISLDNQTVEESTTQLAQNSIKTTMSKETQTTRSSHLMRTCGIVDVSMDNKKFTLHCYFCDEPFPLWDWAFFVRHVSLDHQGKITSTLPTLPPLLLDRPFKIIATQGEVLTEDIPIQASNGTPPQEMETAMESETSMEEIGVVPVGLSAPNFDDSETSETEETEQTDDSSHSNMEEDVFTTKGESQRQLNFNNLEPPVVLSFLDLLKARPILWKGDEVSSDEHTLALTDLATTFNEKWKHNLTNVGLRKTIIRVKAWFLKQLHNSTYGDPPTGITQTYFQKCTEFLPSVPSVLDFICALCGGLFADEVKLQIHQVLEHPISDFPFKCKSCEWRYVDARKLELHERCHRPFYCDSCRKNCETSDEFREHMAAHEEFRTTSFCRVCRKQFKCPSRYRQHYEGVHATPKYKCPICGKGYRKKPMLRYHIRAHNNQRDFVCEECGKSFVRPQGLKQHKEEAHTLVTGRIFVCKICNREFKTRSQLSTHQTKVHVAFEGTNEELELLQRRRGRATYTVTIDPVTKLKRYHCDQCECKFRYSGGLQRHRKDKHGYVPPKRRAPIKRKSEHRSEANEAGRVVHKAPRVVHNEVAPSGTQGDELVAFIDNEDFKTADAGNMQDNIHTEMFRVSQPYTIQKRFHCEYCQCKFTFASGLYRHRRVKHGYMPANPRRPKTHESDEVDLDDI